MNISSHVTHSRKRLQVWSALVVAILAASSWLVVRADVPRVASGTWVAAGDIVTPSGAAAVALPDGRMLVMGGTSDGVLTTGVSTYDPASGAWTARGDLTMARAGHAAAILKDGRVLIAGGTASYGPTFDIEIYDPGNRDLGARRRHDAGPRRPRRRHPQGRPRAHRRRFRRRGAVEPGRDIQSCDRAEHGSPRCRCPSPVSGPRRRRCSTDMCWWSAAATAPTICRRSRFSIQRRASFFPTGAMQTARSGHVAVLLPNNNQVLIAGGMSAGAAVASAELYADWRDGFSMTPNPMSAARAGAIAGGLRRARRRVRCRRRRRDRRVLRLRDGEDGS